jgi:hypothetical protein
MVKKIEPCGPMGKGTSGWHVESWESRLCKVMVAATNFLRKIALRYDFPGLCMESWDLGLFEEIFSRTPANLLAGTPAPA